MKSRLPLVLALVGVFGAGLTSIAIDARADPAGPPPPPPPEDQASPDSPDHFKFSDADRAAFLDARIAALHAGLSLTADQEKLWPPVESALRDFDKLLDSERVEKSADEHPDPIAWLKRLSDNEVARGGALKKVADAAAPLYATLSEDQKHRLPILVHTAHFRFGPLAFNGGWHPGFWRDHFDHLAPPPDGGPRGPDHGPDDEGPQ
jgi:zinc resistance-associated protein